MSLQYDDDDFDDDDDDMDDAPDMEGEPPIRPRTPPSPSPHAPRPSGKRRLRTRPMTPAMMEKHPHVVSILLTRSNGQQLIFIRR